MKKYPVFATIGLLFSIIFLHAQNTTPPLSGTWEIDEESSPFISFLHTYTQDPDQPEFIDNAFSEEEDFEIVPPGGIQPSRAQPTFERLWKFCDNGYLLTRDISWRLIAMPYELKETQLNLVGRGPLEIIEHTNEKLVLYSSSLDTFKLTRFHGETTLFDEPERFIAQKEVGDFRCDGIYHYKIPEGSPGLEKGQVAGLDIRFFPDSTLFFSYSEEAPDVDPGFFRLHTHRGGLGVLPFPFDKIYALNINQEEYWVEEQKFGFNIRYEFRKLEEELEWTNKVLDLEGKLIETKILTFQFYPLEGLTYYFELETEDDNPKTPPSLPEPPPPPPPPASTDVLREVEEMPSFPGCEDINDKATRKACADRKMLEFIYHNIRYPEKAIKKNVEGTCVVQFIVEKDGQISNAKVVRDIGAGCGEESLRVVNLMRERNITWNPGKMDGENVRVLFNLPIKFRLTD